MIKYQVTEAMKKKQLPDLLTITETCEALKVHSNTLRNWDKKGILKAIRFGQRGDRRYKREDISKFIDTK